MTSHFQKHMAHIDAMKPQADANLAQLRTHTINTMTSEQRAALSPVELIAARRQAQIEFQAALKAKKLNYKGFQKG